jgi:plastocyanin
VTSPRRGFLALRGSITVSLALLAVGPASAAETVEVLWTGNPSVGGTTIEVQVGDTIEWDVRLSHDLSELPSQALFDACDFTGSTLISIGPDITETTFNTPGVHYFACSVGGGFHCELLNMNVTVVVSGPEPPAVPVLAWPPGLAAALVMAGLVVLRLKRRGRPDSSDAEGGQVRLPAPARSLWPRGARC